MPHIDVPDCAEFTIHGDYAGLVPLDMTEFVTWTDPWTSGILTDVCEAIIGWWTTNIAPLVQGEVNLVSVKGVDISEEAGISAEVTSGAAGTRTGTVSVLSAPCVVMFKGQNSGLPRRHLNYLSGAVETDVDGRLYSSSYVEDVGDAFSLFEDAVQGVSGAMEHVAVSRYAGFTLQTRPNGTRFKKPTPRTVGLVNPIEVATARRLVGSMKKRRV